MITSPSPSGAPNTLGTQLVEKPSLESLSRDRTPVVDKTKKFNEFKARSSSVMNQLKTPIHETKKLRTLINNDANLINEQLLALN